MSGLDPEKCGGNVVSIGSSDAEALLCNVRSLRDQIVIAWRERSVLLSADERNALHAEIKQTCKFLEDLTRNA